MVAVKSLVFNRSDCAAIKQAAKRTLLGQRDPLFDELAMREVPAQAIHRIRNYHRDVEEIERRVSREILKINVSTLLVKPLKFLITKSDNETISKLATGLLVGINALAGALFLYIFKAAPELISDALKVWLTTNSIVAAFVLTTKNMLRFRQLADSEIDNLARSNIEEIRK